MRVSVCSDSKKVKKREMKWDERDNKRDKSKGNTENSKKTDKRKRSHENID